MNFENPTMEIMNLSADVGIISTSDNVRTNELDIIGRIEAPQ